VEVQGDRLEHAGALDLRGPGVLGPWGVGGARAGSARRWARGGPARTGARRFRRARPKRRAAGAPNNTASAPRGEALPGPLVRALPAKTRAHLDSDLAAAQRRRERAAVHLPQRCRRDGRRREAREHLAQRPAKRLLHGLRRRVVARPGKETRGERGGEGVGAGACWAGGRALWASGRAPWARAGAAAGGAALLTALASSQGKGGTRSCSSWICSK
jgi:hypothetical protein